MLPLEIGFLAHHGYTPEKLHLAAALAALSGVSPAEAAVRAGIVPEEDFYRALARELRLPFLATPRIGRATRYAASLHAGIAPLAQAARFVFAPRGRQLSGLIQSRHAFAPHLAITSPALLRRAVFKALARQIAHLAAHQLPSRAPHLSSRDGATVAQALLLGIVGGVALSAGALVPEILVLVAAAGFTPLFLATVLLRLSAAFVQVPPPASTPLERQPDARLPVYTVIAPLYREARVAERLMKALAALDYPKMKLDIKLVLEANDSETRAVLDTLPIPPWFDIVVAPPGHPQTKPRALNVALPLARGRYTVIYDADDVPDADQLRRAVEAFSRLPPEVACLQARLTIENSADTWLTRLFTIEYAGLFDVVNPGLLALGSPILLGGTSNHFRTAALRQLGGWDAWNVTEDADLGIRLARFGYRTADLPSSTYEEAPVAVGAWLKQRIRWMKGFMQTCITHSREPRTVLAQLGPARSAAVLALTFGTVASALAYPLFAAAAILILMGRISVGDGNFPETFLALSGLLLFTFGMASIMVPAWLGLRRRELLALTPWLPLMPFYFALVSAAAWLALWELASDPFRWNKTEHGLARTSRRGEIISASGGPARHPRAGG